MTDLIQVCRNAFSGIAAIESDSSGKGQATLQACDSVQLPLANHLFRGALQPIEKWLACLVWALALISRAPGEFLGGPWK